PRWNAHCGLRRSVSRHPQCAAGSAGDQWKQLAEEEVSQVQCTVIRRFRNSPLESTDPIFSHVPDGTFSIFLVLKLPRLLSPIKLRPSWTPDPEPRSSKPQHPHR